MDAALKVIELSGNFSILIDTSAFSRYQSDRPICKRKWPGGDRLWKREHDQEWPFGRADLYAVGYEALTAQEGMARHALSQFRAMLVVLPAASIVLPKRPEDSWRPNRFARFHGSLECFFFR